MSTLSLTPWSRQIALGLLAGTSVITLAACGGDSNANEPTTACNESLGDALAGDPLTELLLVREFKTGEPLSLDSNPQDDARVATADVCVVKLNVGPGNPGPADAPSTSAGIGIEVWLPTGENWNDRIHVKGGGGWAGGVQGSTTALAGVGGSSSGSPATTAMVEGAVSASTDTGHTVMNGAFTVNPDGSVSEALWRDFSERSLHEMAVKTKALTEAYYGRPAAYSYFNGFSTGGRQGHKLAQAHPDDFDGILAGAPAFNWTKFITNELYPQIVMQRDLGGPLSGDQLNLVSNAAIQACDVVGGQHLGYIADPASCTYDPTLDASVLCAGEPGNGGITGTNTTAACVNLAEAQAVNKIWYGQTVDGSAPAPAADNSWKVQLDQDHKWYGLARGTSLVRLAGESPFPISADMVALEMDDFTIGLPVSRGTPFANDTLGTGADGWRDLSFAQLADAWDIGVERQPQYAHINTDDPNLAAFRDSDGKMLMYHGLSDTLIMPQGTVQYYHRVAERLGGFDAIQNFYRFYLVPAMDHGFGNGTSNPDANPPLPSNEQLYAALTAWVENGEAPGTLIATADEPAKSRPLCVYPLKATYTQGDPNQAGSYTCS